MIATVRAIALPPMAAGFRLAGVPCDEVRTPREAAERLLGIVTEEDAGVVLVEQRLLDAVPEATRRELEKRATPILVAVPPPQWTARHRADDYILDLLQRAIGYRVRLQ
jgi:vacuolar-type H+-ATPase subunit F/Vma7